MMPFPLSKSSELIFLPSLLIFMLHVSTSTANPLYNQCSNTDTYPANSTFVKNVNSFLSSLSSNTPVTGFYNASIGESPDRVYGLAQCRSDTRPAECYDCIKSAIHEIIKNCPKAIIWYDRCLLRYNGQNASSSSENFPVVFIPDAENVTDPIRFNQLLVQMMSSLASRVDYGPDMPMYATNETNFTSFQSIYGLVQCANDLSRHDCRKCLEVAVGQIPVCCYGRQGGRVLGPSCNLRFELYQFYRHLAVAPASASPSLDSSHLVSVGSLTNTTSARRKQKPSRSVIIIVVPTVIAIVLFSAVAACFLRRKAKRRVMDYGLDRIEDPVYFDLEQIRTATDNFSQTRKLGEGIFGAVYKGRLPDGREIAVRRLSRNAQQIEAFETQLTGFHHRNLVRLWGFCIQGEEKLLVNEYIPNNNSLANILFDPIKRQQLDWPTRYRIITGIARGLFFLHFDCSVRIIHGNHSARNVLLDSEMDPNLSDFAMERLFRLDHHDYRIQRIHRACHGYMAPEYVLLGRLSVLSDVYSFGVLILEIVTGQRYLEPGLDYYLLHLARKHWLDGTISELVDPAISESGSDREILKCIHIAFLCVEDVEICRPSMPLVMRMLSGYDYDSLPSPSFSIPPQPLPSTLMVVLEDTSTTTDSDPEATTDSNPSLDISSPAVVVADINEQLSITEVQPR